MGTRKATRRPRAAASALGLVVVLVGSAAGVGPGCSAVEGTGVEGQAASVPVPPILPAIPVMPVAMTLPSQPIVAGSGDLGYLPGSGQVGPSGQWTYSIPIETPAGRMDAVPRVGLAYDSGGVNGVAGVGWSVSGLSSITRCAHTLSTEGDAQGVTYTDFSSTPEAQRDRFCLDGQKLMSVAGSYGQDGAHYRTEEDVYSDIVSTSTSSDARTQGPDSFIVQTKAGMTLVYDAVAVQRWSSTLGGASAPETIRVGWALARQIDSSGNGVEYHYKTFTDANDAQQTLPTEIDYTTFGGATGSPPTDVGSRKVVFTYDGTRPDQESSWQGGVSTRLLERLSAITVYAPNPGKVMPVWTYLLSYEQSKFSKRSLLGSVRRCANKDDSPTDFGGCTWSKEFHWTDAGKPTFTTRNVLGPIGISGIATDVWEAPTNPPSGFVSSGSGTFAVGPYLQVFDADGDGDDDVMLQPGALPQTLGFTGPAIAPPMMLTATRSGATVHPLAKQWNLKKNGGAYQPPVILYSYDPNDGTGNSGYTPWGNWFAPLERVFPLDVNATGRAGIFLQVPVFDHDGLSNGNCSNKIFNWEGASGFVDSGLKFPEYDCSETNVPTQFAQFLDFDGDGRLDYMQAGIQPPGGGDPDPSDSAPAWVNQPGEWQMMLNEGGHFAPLGPAPVGTSLTAACPTYVVDFDGRGHGAVFGQVGTDVAYQQVQSNPTDPDGTVSCGSAATMIWSPFTNHWTRTVDASKSMPPLVNGLSTTNGGSFYGVVSPVENGTFAPSFGDYNGDGLEDVIWVDQFGKGVFLRWNTGNGFGPSIQITNAPWAVLDLSKWGPFHPPTFQIRVADMNGDGRVDLVVFHVSPAPSITMMLSNGDGTFDSVDMAEDPGQVTALGWTTSRIGDFNGDGLPDIVRLAQVGGSSNDFGANYGDSALATLQVLLQNPRFGDLLESVQDEPTKWARETVTYESQWSDKPESVAACSYPQQCQTRGSGPLVRELDLRDGLTNPPSAAQVDAPHRIFMSYEDPVSDLRGRGALGFGKVRTWDPLALTQTITEYDHRTEVYGKYYPGAGRPARVTTVVALPSPGKPQKLPVLPGAGAASTYARVTQTTYANQLVRANGGATYVVQPQQVVTSEWEQLVQMAASPTDSADPTSDYVWGVTMPASPLRVHTSSIPAAMVDGNGVVTQYGGIDADGNMTQKTEATHGGETVVLSAKYADVTSNGRWQLGLLQSLTAVATENDGTTDSRVAAYDYDSQGRLKDAYRQMSAAAPVTVATTTYSRDSYGNVVSVVAKGPDPQGGTDSRQINIEYGPVWPGQPDERIFPSQTWVPVNLPAPGGFTWSPSRWTAIHPAYGVLIESMDANGVQTVSTYDDLGRPRSTVTDGDAPATTTYAARPDSFGGDNGMIVSTTLGGQTLVAMSDADGRTIQTTQLAFDGKPVDTQTVYDLLGRALSVSRPFPDGINPEYSTTYLYDGLNRLVRTVFPDGTQSLVAPTFFTTTTTDPNGNLSAVTIDVDGRTVQTESWLEEGNSPATKFLLSHWLTTQYHAYPFGLVDRVTDPEGNQWTTLFDGLGRVIGSHGPDAGTVGSVQYDAFDEPLQSTHVESGAVTTGHFDALGRITSWNTTDGPTGATYTYDTAANGLGLLATSTSSDQITTQHVYDVHGREAGSSQTIDGQTYTLGTSYYASGPSMGRVQQRTYPSVAGSTQAGMTLTYQYTNAGYLSNIQYRTSGMASAERLYTVTSRALDGSLLTAYDGSPPESGANLIYSYLPSTGQLQELKAYVPSGVGYVYDLSYEYYPNGLVEAKTERTSRRIESFTYDTVSRLSGWVVSLASAACTGLAICTAPIPTMALGYAYSDSGNLTQVQQQSLAGTSTALENDSYGVTAGPHALTTHQTAAGSIPYQYDTHGRLIDGGGRSLTYNGVDLPMTVTIGQNVWSFKYDAYGSRVEKSSPIEGTTVSVGGVYEHRTGGAAGPEDVFMVPGIAQIDVVGGGAPQVTYLLNDALGSVGVAVDATGAKPPARFFYGPFGDLQNVDGTPSGGAVGDVRTLFTGQEQDDDFGAIDFKGRLYDPSLKRFFSADPHVTHPGFGQSWNPYSYVLNDPVNLTDPSGFDDFDDDTPPTLDQISQSAQWLGAGAQTGDPRKRLQNGRFVSWTVSTSLGTLVFTPGSDGAPGSSTFTPSQSTNNNGATAGYVAPGPGPAASEAAPQAEWTPPPFSERLWDVTNDTLNKLSWYPPLTIYNIVHDAIPEKVLHELDEAGVALAPMTMGASELPALVTTSSRAGSFGGEVWSLRVVMRNLEELKAGLQLRYNAVKYADIIVTYEASFEHQLTWGAKIVGDRAVVVAPDGLVFHWEAADFLQALVDAGIDPKLIDYWSGVHGADLTGLPTGPLEADLARTDVEAAKRLGIATFDAKGLSPEKYVEAIRSTAPGRICVVGVCFGATPFMGDQVTPPGWSGSVPFGGGPPLTK